MKALTIAVDSRERTPSLRLDGKLHSGWRIEYRTQGLDTFDYAVWGDWQQPEKGHETVTPNFAIERKSLDDLIGSWFSGENARRELAKIERARSLWGAKSLPIVYAIECKLSDVARYDFGRFPSGRVTARAVYSKLQRLNYEHGIHWTWCDSAAGCEWWIAGTLKRRREAIDRAAKKALDATRHGGKMRQD